MGEELSLVDWEDSFDCLQLDNHFVAHDQIHLISAVEWQAFVEPGTCRLNDNPLTAKTFFVSRFKKAGPEVAMDLDGCCNDWARSGITILLFAC
jgi:hypothetical protein